MKKKLLYLSFVIAVMFTACDNNEVISPKKEVSETLANAGIEANKISNLTGILQKVRGRNLGSGAFKSITGNGRSKFSNGKSKVTFLSNSQDNPNGGSDNDGNHDDGDHDGGDGNDDDHDNEDDDCGYWGFECENDSTNSCDSVWVAVDCDWNDGDDWDWGWESCATVTETENSDGSFTIVEDYGVDGCDEGGLLIKGKITTTYSYTWTTSQTAIVYENYSFDGITMNGTVSSNDSWEFDVNTDSLSFSFSFNSAFEEDITFTYEDGTTDHYVSDMTLAGTETQMSIDGIYQVESSNGDSYSSVISTPLIYDYSCATDPNNFVFIPVIGVENSTYNGDEMSLNYGDGTCDNIVSITAGGETIDVDLGKDGL